MSFEKPKNVEEVRDLKRAATNLLREHDEAFVARKLRSMGLDPASFTDHASRAAEAGAIKKSTVDAYIRRGTGLYRDSKQSGVDVWALAESRAKTAPSWYAARAALQYFLRSKVRAAKNVLDQWEKVAGQGQMPLALKTKALEAIDDLPRLATALASMPPDGVPEVFMQAGNGKRRRSSKSKSLAGLPDDWQLRVVLTMPPSLRMAYLVQCVTGCRPVELPGATVRLGGDGQVHTAVLGGKVRRNAGQPMREMSVQPTSGVARELALLLAAAGGQAGPGLLDRSVAAYRSVVERRGAELWSRRAAATRPTAYSTRHQFKSDAVHAGLSREELAAAMGHRSEKSAAYYGGASRRTGSVVPTKVSATHAIRKRTEADYAAMKAKSARSSTNSAAVPPPWRKQRTPK